MNPNLKKLSNRKCFQILVAGVLVFSLISGFWFALELVFCADPPISFVSSNYMNINSRANEWDITLFGMTLSIGDLIFIQGVEPNELDLEYPDSDIIVFKNPDSPKEHIALRLVAREKIDGKWYFFVKGDGSGSSTWPDKVGPADYMEWKNQNSSLPLGAVCEDLVAGKVAMRVPLVGILSVFIHNRFGVDDNFLAVTLPFMVVTFGFVVVKDFVVPFLAGKIHDVQQKRQKGIR